MGPEHSIRGHQGCLVGSQGPVERMAPERLDPLAASHDETCLWTTEQFVAREADRVRARIEQRGHRRLRWQTPAPEIVKRPRSLIDEEGQAVGMGQISQLGNRRRCREADDTVVRTMGHQDGGGGLIDRSRVVGEVRAVGTAHLTED